MNLTDPGPAAAGMSEMPRGRSPVKLEDGSRPMHGRRDRTIAAYDAAASGGATEAAAVTPPAARVRQNLARRSVFVTLEEAGSAHERVLCALLSILGYVGIAVCVLAALSLADDVVGWPYGLLAMIAGGAVAAVAWLEAFAVLNRSLR